MIRLLVSFVIQLAANALGFIVAASILDKMEVSNTGFVVAVVIFTIVYALAQPFLTQMALSKASALRGGVALVATLVGLIVTALIVGDDDLKISGAATWIEATVIIWIVSLLGVLILPAIFVKKKVQEKRG
jgi:putative membrane protein